jgi:5-formyltetrahydrofolate cyclo-ligase
MNSFAQYRQQMCQQRRALTPSQRVTAAGSVLQWVTQQKLIEPYRHIAFYYPVQGELDPSPIIQQAWQAHKSCYLPILPPNQQKALQFMPYATNTTLIKNRYHIPEPEYDANTIISAQQLELVFVPLVAFDPKGNRLGMGAGFYDTTFAFTRENRHDVQLMGLAYEFQRVDSLQPQPWDIPLTAIITEKQVYWR